MAKMCFQFLFAILVALQLGSNVEARFDYDYEDGGSFFSSSNIIEIPDSCKGKPFCFERGENYPYEMIDKVVKNLRNMELQVPRNSIGSRSGNEVTDFQCKTTVNNDLIYYITDINNKERVVVQSKAEDQFRQYYNLTWCAEEIPITSTPYFLRDMKCVTKTMDLDFFVLNDDYISENPKLTVATARIPVCCRCEYDADEFNNNFYKFREDLMKNANQN